MLVIMEWLFDAWPILVGISVVTGIVSALITFRKVGSSENQPVAIRLLVNLIFTVSIVIVLASCAIGLSFTRVPDVCRRTVSEAEELLTDAGLQLSLPTGMTKNAETLAKTVTGQDHEPGQFIPKGMNISVDIAFTVNPPTQNYIDVPAFVGEQYIDALDMLTESGLRYCISVTGEKNVSIENAYIISQSIAAGASVPEGSLIELELSAQENNTPSVSPSADLIEVPYVVDMKEQEAVKTMEECGLTVQVWWLTGVDESLDSYYIVSQSIPAGSMVPVGTLVELERSGIKTGTPVNVPNVVGMEQQEATALLTNMGLQFQVWWTEESNISSEYYYIVNQSIPADSSVPAGTLVRLELSPIKP